MSVCQYDMNIMILFSTDCTTACSMFRLDVTTFAVAIVTFENVFVNV